MEEEIGSWSKLEGYTSKTQHIFEEAKLTEKLPWASDLFIFLSECKKNKKTC